VLLPAPDERPALTNYQEAGQFPGGWLRGWQKMVFGEKPDLSDSKTGRCFCPQFMQNRLFA
jgi:hypothetical protein